MSSKKAGVGSQRGSDASSATASSASLLELYADTAHYPKTLFHYTSASGLLGIYRSGKIYATHIGYLNDASEYVFAYGLFAARLRQHAEESEYEEASAYLAHLVDWISRARPIDAGFYVASFSADGDVLSQWRGYCSAAGGYSIGFSTDDLFEAADSEVGLFPGQWRLVRCEYEAETQIGLVDAVIQGNLKVLSRLEAGKRSDLAKYFRHEAKYPPKELNDLIGDIQLGVSQLAPVLKHGAFRDEQEYRVVSPRIIDGDPCIKYRASESRIIPYVDFPLPGGQTAKLAQVVVGPAENQELSAHSAFQLCGVPIPTRSRIPYRQLS